MTMLRPKMTIFPARLLVAALLLAAGCGGKAGVGLVTVAVEPLAPPVKQLRLVLAAGGPTKTVVFPAAEGAALAFPVSVSVTYSRGVTGFLTAEVDGLSGGQVVARGGGNGALLAEGTVMVAVTLRAPGGSEALTSSTARRMRS